MFKEETIEKEHEDYSVDPYEMWKTLRCQQPTNRKDYKKG